MNLATYLFRAVVLFSAMLLVSCATLLSGAGNFKVQINSTPAGAEVYDRDGKFLGKTPLSIRLPKDSRFKVSVKKESYETYEHTFLTSYKNGFLFLDAMLLCIPCPVDMSNRSLEKIANPELMANMRKIPIPRADTLLVGLAEPEFALEKESLIGTYRKEKMYFKVNDYAIGSKKQMRSIVCNASQSMYLKFRDCAKTNQNNLFDYTGSAPYTLKPVVRKLMVNIYSTRGKDFGSGTITLDWQLIDERRGENKLETFTTECDFACAVPLTRSLVDSLFLESYYMLMNNTGVFDVLESLMKGKDFGNINAKTINLPMPQLPKFEKIKDCVKYVTQSVVTIQHSDGFGSGFIISADGYLLTNFHVVQERKEVNIKLHNGTLLPARVLQIDRAADLALLKLNVKDLVPIKMGNADSVELGEDVLAIGTPTSTELGQTITKGIVSGKRKVEDMVYIQTDVTINGGNSGGPLLNEKGEAIGIITMKLVGRDIDGLGFCVPINKAMQSFGLVYQ